MDVARRIIGPAGAAVVLALLLPPGAASGLPVESPSAPGPPADPAAYWPTMRHDLRNTGASPLPGKDPGTRPWSYDTGKGIFSTPVIDADGTIYVGSADHILYGLDPAGTKTWQFETGGIIDTAPALLAPEPGIGRSLIVGSGDELMYKVRTDPQVPPKDRVQWTFSPTVPPVAGAQLVSWWEGSPNVGPDGTIYQGNTGGAAYAVLPDGTQKWAYQAQNSVWTVPALDDSGTTFWGSVDLTAFALDPDGTQKWKRTTLGYITSSPALDTQGTLYLGSFDGNVYALDSANGSVRWQFPTGDHIYSSAALVESTAGTLEQIVIGSTDGVLYGLSPTGEQLWAYDTGAPIRSSPVIGQAPDGGAPIAYVGSANGHLYAIDTSDGSRRWAFDTTSDKPELATRSQLNSSPALGPKGIYIGGQDGVIWGVPYDYCLRAASDPRCVAAADELPADGTFVFGVDVGGGIVADGRPVDITPAGYLTGRLMIRDNGRTVPARMVPAPDPARMVTVTPDFERDVSLSGDGRYIFIRPREMLAANTDYTVTVSGVTTTGGPRIGNVDLGPGDVSAFSGSFTARTGDDGTAWDPQITDQQVSGLSLSRLAVPLPPMLTSVNQIGFDFYDWIGGPVRTDEDSTVVWFVGAKRTQDGSIVSDPGALFAFPVFGEQRGGTFSWSAAQVNLWFTFGPVPLRRFDLRGTFDSSGTVEPDAQFLAEAVCADTPGYGPRLPATGMCDTQGVITAAGTYLGKSIDSPAVRRVPGLRVGDIDWDRPPGTEGSVSAEIDLSPDTHYSKDDHFVSVLLIDADTGEPVPLDYYSDTTMTTDASGDITGTSVRIGADVVLPTKVEAIVMTDAFPAKRTTLPTGSAP